MDAGFQNLDFAVNPSLNASKYLGKSIQVDGAGDGHYLDTILRLDSHGSYIPLLSAAGKGIKRKWSLIDRSIGQQVGSSLCLKLGHSSSSSDSKGSSATVCTTVSSAKETDEESSMEIDLDFSLHLGNEKIYSPKKSESCNLKAPDVQQPKVDLQLSLSAGHTESDITSFHLSSTPSQNPLDMPLAIDRAFHMDEGSTSLRWETGSIFHPLNTPKEARTCFFLNQAVREIHPAPLVQDLSSSVVTIPKSSVTCTSGFTQQQQQRSSSSSGSSKTCRFEGCGKGARGASGFCIAHGGGRRCQKPGCLKGAEGRTVYCKAHGGGRRCEFLGCTKSAEGRTDFCIAHGGGRRCSLEGCTRAARGKSGLCIRHGGGKRCQKENCTKSAEGLSGLCISHGGGRRCQHPACAKGAQGSTMFCKAHGGGKRCTFEGCTKGAEGSTPFCKGHGGGKRCSFQGGGVCPKSVHGGTLFCVAHGGGKRCAMPECTKSARGRTDFCVRHGGGKRCKFEGCGKSAQGSTDFCKAHGGGKRCSWGQPGSEFGQGDGQCNSFARGKTGLCTSHGALVQDKRVHGGATVGAMVQDPKPTKPEKMKEVVNAEDIIPIPGPTSTQWKQFKLQQARLRNRDGALSATPVLVPEGRVHGGSLMAMLAESSGRGLNGSKSKSVVVGSSDSGKSHAMPHYWM